MEKSKHTFRLTATLPEDAEEEALGLLYAFGMVGCEELFEKGLITIRGYFIDQEALLAAEKQLVLQWPDICTGSETVVEQDWNRSWREQIIPVKVTDDIWVSPAWRKPTLTAGEQWINIEPKMAFGTGHHESTRLAAGGLCIIRERLTGARVVDVGTGSGILCFVSALYGASACVGVEIDTCARENLAENLRENPSKARVSFLIGTLDAVRTSARFDVAVVNMIRTEAEPWLSTLHNLLTPSGTIVWSGLLFEEKDKVIVSLQRSGFSVESDLRENEWWASIARKCD